INETRQRIVWLRSLPPRALLLAALARVAHRRNDGAIAHKRIDDLRRLVEEPSRVPAKIEHDSLELSVSLQVRTRGLQIGRCIRLKLTYTHVADPTVEKFVIDRPDVDNLSRQLERSRALPTVGAVPVNPDVDLRSRLTTQMVDGLVEAHVQRLLGIYLRDPIVPLHPRAPCRRPRSWLHRRERLGPPLHYD